MSNKAVDWALNIVDERLTQTQRLVLVGIASHDGKGGAWPSVETLARYAGVHKRNAQRAIVGLVELGYLEVDMQEGGNRWTKPQYRTNLYRLIGAPTPPEGSPAPPLEEPDDEPGVAPAPSLGVAPAPPEPSIEPSITTTHTLSQGTLVVATVPVAEIELRGSSFDDWWALYPRRVGKGAARTAWTKAVKRLNGDVEVLMQRTRLQVFVWAQEQREARFIPHPATWLNQERYDDDMTPTAPASKAARSMAAIERVTGLLS